MVVKNVGSPLKFIDQKSSLPSSFATGVAIRAFDKLTLSTDIDLFAAGSPILRQGVEYNYSERVFLRTGYEYKNIGGKEPVSPTVTFGGGLKISNLQFDYAFSRYKLMDYTHTLSLTYRFGQI
jgi:hypothetical protein